MSRALRLIAFVVAASGLAASVSAELTPAQQALAQAALRDFTAPDFQTRQQAVDRLVALGVDVVGLVRKTLAGTTDNEVRLRCEMTLRGIAVRWGVVVDLKNPDAPVVVNLGPSKVTLALRDTPLKDVLDALAAASGNEELLAATAVKDRPVSLAAKDVCYWEAVDELCRTNGLLLALDPATGRPALVEREGTLDPGVVAGPVAIKFNSGSVSRTFRATKNAWSRSSGSATVAYNLGVYWEDRLNVATVVVEITKAVLPGGKDLLEGATVSRAQTLTPGTRAKNYAAGYLSIPGLPEGTRRIESLQGLVKVTSRVGERSLRIEDVLAGPPRSTAGDGVSLSLKSVVDRRRGAVVLTVELKREGGDPAISFATESGHAGFALVDPKGVRHGGAVDGGRFGTKKTGRRNRQGQDETAEEAELNLRFNNLPDVEGPWSLVLAWPERVDTREYAFRLADVPVP